MGDIEVSFGVYGSGWVAVRSVQLPDVPRRGELLALWPDIEQPGVQEHTYPGEHRVDDVAWHLPDDRHPEARASVRITSLAPATYAEPRLGEAWNFVYIEA